MKLPELNKKPKKTKKHISVAVFWALLDPVLGMAISLGPAVDVPSDSLFNKAQMRKSWKEIGHLSHISLWGGPFWWGTDAQMGAGLDHEFRLDLEIGPMTIHILSWNKKP